MASKEVYPKDVIKALRKLGFSVIKKKEVTSVLFTATAGEQLLPCIPSHCS